MRWNVMLGRVTIQIKEKGMQQKIVCEMRWSVMLGRVTIQIKEKSMQQKIVCACVKQEKLNSSIGEGLGRAALRGTGMMRLDALVG